MPILFLTFNINPYIFFIRVIFIILSIQKKRGSKRKHSSERDSSCDRYVFSLLFQKILYFKYNNCIIIIILITFIFSSPPKVSKSKSKKKITETSPEQTRNKTKNIDDSHAHKNVEKYKNRRQETNEHEKELSRNKPSQNYETESKSSKKYEHPNDKFNSNDDRKWNRSRSRDKKDFKKFDNYKKSRSPLDSRRRSKTPKRKDNYQMDTNKKEQHPSKYSHGNRDDRDVPFYKNKRNESKSPARSKNKRSPSPKRDKDKLNKKPIRNDDFSPKRQNSPSRHRESVSPYKKDKYKPYQRKFSRSPYRGRHERYSRSPRTSRKNSDRQSNRRGSPDRRDSNRNHPKTRSPYRGRSRTPKNRKISNEKLDFSKSSEKNKMIVQSVVDIVKTQKYKKPTEALPRTPDHSPPRKTSSLANSKTISPVIENDTVSEIIENHDILKAKSPNGEKIISKSPKLNDQKNISPPHHVRNNTTSDSSSHVHKEGESNLETPGNSKHVDGENVDKDEEDPKRSPSVASKSSSSLSYSPARRNPERYIDVLDKLSEKDKSKYIQPSNKKLIKGNSQKDQSVYDVLKKSRMYRNHPQPVVCLRASSSDDDDSEAGCVVTRLDEDYNQEIKELNLLQIDLAAIVKESVEKKRLEHKARDEGNVYALQISTTNTAASSSGTNPNPNVDRNESGSSESMDISPEHKASPKKETVPKSDVNSSNNEENPKVKIKDTVETSRRKLQTPDKSRSSSRSRSRSRSISSMSSESSRY